MRRITGCDYLDESNGFRLIKAKKANLREGNNLRGYYWGFRDDSISFHTHFLLLCLRDGKLDRKFLLPKSVLSCPTSFRIYEHEHNFDKYLIKGDL